MEKLKHTFKSDILFKMLFVKYPHLLSEFHFFELPKMPNIESIDPSNEKELWLALFNATTEEELENLTKIGGATMSEAVQAYRSITATEEYRLLKLKRSMARHDEAQALYNAEMKRDEHWQGVVAEKDAIIAELMARINQK